MVTRQLCKLHESSNITAAAISTAGSQPEVPHWAQRGSGQIMVSKHKVQVRRAYDEAERGDGKRVLVDRIWPRGLSKEKADFDEWCKQVAPSTDLRKWYNHDEERYAEFKVRYKAELKEPERAEVLEHLRALARHGNLSLITATKQAEISEAAVLADLLRG